MEINDLRKEYTRHTLSRKDLDLNPFNQFTIWFNEAIKANIMEPNAMILATATKDGIPSSRTVLMKEFSENGLCFFTNFESRKGQELRVNPRASATFLWKEVERQIHIEGTVVKCSREEAEKHFHLRTRNSQISAWVSQQSRPIISRDELEKAFREGEKRFYGKEIPLPSHWGGFRIIPKRFEFWQGRPDRLHDRFAYVYEADKGSWDIQRLSP